MKLTGNTQLKLAALAVFLGAVILVFFSRATTAWAAETIVVVWFAALLLRERRSTA